MDRKLFIPVLLGTNRKDRRSENPAKFIFGKMQKRFDMETRFFDARDFDMPADDYGENIKDSFPEYRDAIAKADGLVIVVPEYNHGYPGILKSILDMLLKEYNHKAVAFVSVSAGPWGGTRVMENMLPIVRELGLSPSSLDLQFPTIKDKFDEKGKLLDKKYNERADKFLDELAWMAKSLSWGRQKLR